MKQLRNFKWLWKIATILIVIAMSISGFSLVIGDMENDPIPRSGRSVTSIKVLYTVGDWDSDNDLPDINITVLDQNNDPLQNANIYGPGTPEWGTQTNESGMCTIFDCSAGQYFYKIDYHVPPDTNYFEHLEFLLRQPNAVFLYADEGIGPFDADFDGNGSEDDIEIQFFRAKDMDPNNDTNVTFSEVRLWMGWQDPVNDTPKMKLKTDKDGVVFFKDLDRDGYKIEISNDTYDAMYHFHIQYDFHIRVDGFWDKDYDGKWRDADIYVYSDDMENNPISNAYVEVWEGNFKKLICNGTTDSSGIFELREGKNNWIDNEDGLFKVKATHNNKITIARLKLGDLFFDAYVCDNDQLGEENDVTMYVYDENGPVKDANCYLYKFGWEQVYKKSDVEGYAFFNNLPEGKHRIDVELNGYWAPSDEIRIGSQLFYIFPDWWNEWDENLQRDTFILRVRVMETPDQWGSDYIENAKVSVEIKDKLEERKTDWNGEAYFRDITPGLYDLNVTFDVNKNGTIESDEMVLEYDFEVGEAVLLDIEVTDLNLDGHDDISIYAHGLKGEPRSGIWLGIRCEDGDNWVWIDYNLQESDHGYFNITSYEGKPLPDGMYKIEFDHMGIRGKELAFIGNGPFYHIKVKIGDFDDDNETDEAEITVLNAFTPLPNIEIYVDKEYQGETEADGKLLVDNMGIGMHTIKAKKKVNDKSVTIASMDRFGIGEFRYIDAWEENRWEDFGTWKYDIRISVRDWPNEFSVSAEIYLDGVLIGMTNNMGMDSLVANGVSEGLHNITAKLAQPYAGEVVSTQFNAGKQHRYFNARWFSANDDDTDNDLELSYIDDDEPILGIEFFVDKWSVGKATLENLGKVLVYNLTPGRHEIEVMFPDNHMEWYEVYGGADDFIVITAKVIEGDQNNYKDPNQVFVEVEVTNKQGQPVPFVEIQFNGRYVGQTNLTGQLMIYDVWERGPCWVDARYWMNDMELWANTMVFIGQQDVLWVKMGMDENLDNDPKDIRNDMELTVFFYKYDDREQYPQGKEIGNVEIYLMGKKVGVTDNDGLFTMYNLTDSQYKGIAKYTDVDTKREFTWEFQFCIGDHRNFLRAEAWMQGPENRDIEIQVWVGSEWGGEEAVQGAKMFHENKYFGSTDWEGRYRGYNLDPGYYFLNITWHNEKRNRDIFGWAEFYIGGKDDYMVVDWYIEDYNQDGNENDVTFFIRNGKEEPINGAELFISGPEERYGSTDTSGKFQLLDLPNGFYKVDIKYMPVDVAPSMGMEQWFYCDFVIGDHGFIWVDIWVESRNGLGRADDVAIVVHSGKDRVIENAEIFIDGMFRGYTNMNGEYFEDDFSDGRHWVDVYTKDEVDGMTMDLYWGGEFFVGEVGGYIWAEAFVYDADNDGKMNDVEIKVYGDRGEFLDDAEVFVHGPTEYYGRTDYDGSVRFQDLGNGYYSADIVYRGIGYGHTTDMDIIHDPGTEQPTMDKITVEITYPEDNHVYTPNDDILVISGTAMATIDGDYISEVLMLIPDGGSDNTKSSEDMFMEYTKVPTKPTGPNGSYDTWRFEVPENPLNSPNKDDHPPVNIAIPLYARAYDDKGGWNQAKINIMFSYDDQSTGGSRGATRQESTTTEPPKDDYYGSPGEEDIPDWITGFYDQPKPFNEFFGAPTNEDIKLSMKAEEMIENNRLVGTCSPDVTNIDLYVSFFMKQYIEWNGKSYPDGAWTNWVNIDKVKEMGDFKEVELRADGTWVWIPPDDDGKTRQSSTDDNSYYDGSDPDQHDDDGPDAIKIGAVAYDSNGTYNYVVSDEIKLPKDDDHYDGHDGNYGEAWAYVEFIIGESGFIFAKAYVTADDSDGRADDVEIKVFDADKNPIEGAEIYIWDTYIGDSDNEGSIRSHDEMQGLDDGFYPVDVIYRAVFECPKCGIELDEPLIEGDTCPDCTHPISEFDLQIYRANTEFVIGTSAVFIKVNAYVKDIDDDGRSDDVAIKVNDLNGNPIENAKVFIDDKYIGKTDSEGYIREFNLYAGRHTVDVLTEDWYTGYTDFFSEGSGESYIYADAYVMNMVSIGIPSPKKNDVLIYVYDKKGTPLHDAEVYFNGIYQGQTTIQGFLSMFDQPEGWYPVDVFWYDEAKGKEYHGYTEFKSEGGGDNYIYSDNVVDDTDENGYADDAIIVVYDANGEPVENARVTIDGEHAGNTSEDTGTRGFGNLGSRGTNLEVDDLDAGWHTITVEYDEIEENSGEVNTITSTRIVKSEGTGEDYIYANAFVTDGDDDGNKNDVKIIVSNSQNSPLAEATITINSEIFTTDSNGLVTVHDLAEGRHSCVAENDNLKCTFSFESKGDGDGNEPPTAEFTIPEKKDRQAGEELTFSAEVEEPDNDRYVCIWNFDDESDEVIGESVIHVFSEPGEYKITLTVSDGIDTVTYSERVTIESASGQGAGAGLGVFGFTNILLIVAVIVTVIVIVIAFNILKKKKNKLDPEQSENPDEDDDKKLNGKPKSVSDIKGSSKIKTKPTVNAKPGSKPDTKPSLGASKPKQQEFNRKRYDAYTAALEQALKDGKITESEDNLLKMLRSKYNITEDEHEMLAVQINIEKKFE